MAYKGGVPVNSGFYPRNDFPIAEAKDIYVSDEQRLDEIISELQNDIGEKVDASTVIEHTGNDDIHVTAADKEFWNKATNKEIVWDDINDKPFSGDVYEDSFDYTVLPELYFDVELSLESHGGEKYIHRFYKFSDLVLNYQQVLKTKFLNNGRSEVLDDNLVPKEEDIIYTTDNFTLFELPYHGLKIFPYITAKQGEYDIGDITNTTIIVPEDGTYISLRYGPEGAEVMYSYGLGLTSGSFYCDDTEKLDEKYLPNISWNNLVDTPLGGDVYEDSIDLTYLSGKGFHWTTSRFTGEVEINRFYNFSGITLTYEQLLKTKFTIGVKNDYGDIVFVDVDIVDDDILHIDTDGFILFKVPCSIDYYFISAINGIYNIDGSELIVPISGLYTLIFKREDDTVYSPIDYVSFCCDDTKKLDEKYLPDTSWNDLTDKPFSDNRTIIYQYTDEYTPLDSKFIPASIRPYGSDYYLYKVSNTPMEKGEFIGTHIEWVTVSNGIEKTQKWTYTSAEVDISGNLTIADPFISVFADTDLGAYYEDYEEFAGIVLTTGLWVRYYESDYVTLLYRGEVDTLDEIYLPEHLVLPNVTWLDNDKILQVKRGSWELTSFPTKPLAYPLIESSSSSIEPDQYSVFGEVDALNVSLVEKDDGYVHEYTFEFIPKEGFSGLTITPEVRWVNQPMYTPGSICQVSVLRGVAIMIYA